MMKTFFFAVLLFGIASAVTTGHSFVGSKAYNQLAELKSVNPDLYNTVQSMLEAGDPVDDIISLLNELRGDIESEQQRANDHHVAKQDQCSSDLDAHNLAIADLRARIADKENDVNQLNGEISDAQSQLEENERLLAENADAQASARASRAAEVEEYNRSVNDHQDAIDAIDEVLRLLDESTLTDIQVIDEKIPALLEKIQPHAMKSIAIRSKVSLIQSLLSSQANLRGDQQPPERKEKVDTIIRLLNELREQFVNSLDVLNRNEKTNEDNFNRLIDALENEEEKINKANLDLSSSLSQLNGKIDNKQSEITALENEIGVIENEVIPALQADCESHAAQFSEETARRTEELDVIDQCIEILGGRVQPRLPGICPNCGENAHCQNKLCVCDAGYRGNGFDCHRDLSEHLPSINLPQQLSQPEAPPADPTKVQLANGYTSTSQVKNYGREPSYNEILRDFPPVETYWVPNGHSSYITLSSKHGNLACNWAQVEGLYLIGYLWVPEGAKSIQVNAGVDDRGYVFINGKQVLFRTCCSMSVSNIHVDENIHTGAWNLIFGAGADGCKGGWFTLRDFSSH